MEFKVYMLNRTGDIAIFQITEACVIIETLNGVIPFFIPLSFLKMINEKYSLIGEF